MNDKKTLTKKEKKLVSFKQNQFYTVITILAFAFGILIGYFIWGTSSSVPVAPTQAAAEPVEAQPAEAEQAQAAEAQAPQRYDIPTEGFPSIGPEDAEIVLVEFSDFGCSYCAKWHNETFEDLMAAYPDQIRFIYHDVPFRAFPASEAARCAEEQDAFWEYHDKLFSYEYGLDDNAFTQYAEALNLDMDSFNTCMSEHRYKEIIQTDLDFATQLGISSTPTFFINGMAIVGAQPLEVFIQIIDQELAGEIPQ